MFADVLPAAMAAVLLMGLSKSGFANGFGAFATPLMALAMPITQAAAVMLPLLLVMDLVSAFSLRKSVDGVVLKHCLPAGVCGVLLGWLLLSVVSLAVVSVLVGAMTLCFLMQRLLPIGGIDWHWRPLAWLMSALSGFASFICHAGGPPMMMYCLARNMAPGHLAGTSAVFFFVVNAMKWPLYYQMNLLSSGNMHMALALLPVGIAGVLLGVYLAGCLQRQWFYRVSYAGLLLAGVKLIVDGAQRW
ncbi:sulfite exporter TauE/SafE family protein [Vogesella indigofera]|uniref:sulfite exporter TauE/SafE family protein n=1 Tax=Vogesella indigofera TaxID=45465 RepID=UPI00234F2EAE|nr:sulfite exporter TauE/SafE family protein [Vogesella indigofera]MDC7710867.1 sulfite exporter TauE/SafE family protein [Vogesella indigofera]